jgi:hypothetical protein
MSPIVQTLANSSAYGYRAFAAAGGDYESIATTTVGSGGAASISFTSIPSTYQHLQIRFMGVASSATDYTMRFNSDTGSNYRGHYLYSDGATAFTGQTFGGVTTRLDFLFNGFSTVNGVMVCDILDYTNTNKYTTTRGLGGYDNNGTGQSTMLSGLWMNTAAINNISITPDSGTFSQYSSFALYGIKG